jgi:O-antigen/teichoic acid export membrane protein
MALVQVSSEPLTDEALTDEAPTPGVSDSVARGALSLLSTQPLTWGASLLAATVMPRLLGADLLGQVTFVSTLALLGSAITGFGIADYLVRRVAQRPHTMRRDLGLALCVQNVTTVVGALAIAFVLPRVTSTIVDTRILLLGLIAMVAAPTQTALLSAFRGSERHQHYAWFNAALQVATSVGAAVVLLTGGTVFQSLAVSGGLLVLVIVMGWKMSGIRPTFPTIDTAMLRDSQDLVRGGLPFVAWTLTQMAYTQLDRLLLGGLASTAEVGWYAASARIIAIPIFVPTLVITPLFPALSRSAHDPVVVRRSVAQALKVVLLLTVPLSAGTFAVAPRIPSLFGWPADFENAVPLMRIMAMQLPLVSVGMVLGATLMSIGRERRLVILALVATLFSVTANVILIQLFERAVGNGGVGSALAMVMSEVLMLIGALLMIPKNLLDPGSARDAIRICLAGVAIMAAGLVLEPISLWLCIAGGAVVYVCVGAVVRAFSLEDLRQIRGYIRARAR